MLDGQGLIMIKTKNFSFNRRNNSLSNNFCEGKKNWG